MGYRGTRNGDPISALIGFVIVIIFVVIMLIKLTIQDEKKRKREENFKKYAKKTGAVTKTYYSEPIKNNKDVMTCFAGMVDPVFYNIIVKEDKMNGSTYIGELQWDKPVGPRSRGRYQSPDYNQSSGVDAKFDKMKNYATMCVFIDDGFRLPNFNLSKETINKKATEILHLNKTVDIDFDEDKKFSEAWWLTSNETSLVKQLFTTNVRNNFMKFVDKGYQICGDLHTIIILTDHLYEPEDYVRLTSDIKAISKFLKTNKKFYTSYEERKKKEEETV